jgi:FtsP/CotA-like multicopper oxidase with cupredoxin domain
MNLLQLAVLSLGGLAAANAIPSECGPVVTEYVTTTVSMPHPTGAFQCPGNTPDNRQQWCQYDVNTDYYETIPETGVTREYWFVISDYVLALDGVPRTVMAVNGSIPGPQITADWGDWVVVHVLNNLTVSQNGTGLHFHGIRQLNTNQMDGVPSVTQCPIAPGHSYTYKWHATQYGSSWYHAHFSLQAWQGVQGGIVINGPATANYDVDMGSFIISDWLHASPNMLLYQQELAGPYAITTGLINGTNTWNDTDGSNVVGKLYETSVEPGKSYRFRVVNSAIDNHFKFSVDDHTLTVIGADFVAIEPFQTTQLDIAMGEPST